MECTQELVFIIMISLLSLVTAKISVRLIARWRYDGVRKLLLKTVYLEVIVMIGAIEAGGTKMICAVSDADLNIQARTRIDTDDPKITIREILDFFGQYELNGLGVGAFGPIGVNPKRKDYGFIGQTPKEGWSGFDLLGALKSELTCPIYLTTDVNVAAYGELKRGAARGLQNAVYLTVGTGIGGGVIHDGEIYVGDTHPELGHMYD